MSTGQKVAEARQYPRLRLPAMYTLVRVRPKGKKRYCWTGYIYDISESGMRFELDAAVDPGTDVEIRAMLPGSTHTTISASGRVVRIHDDENIGPMRMGLIFDTFETTTDREQLHSYLKIAGMRAA